MNTYDTSKLSTFNTTSAKVGGLKSHQPTTKETALKKRLNLVLQNCEIVFILANSKPHSQAYVKQFENSFFQKVSFPKHALNYFCLNFHMPIKGCHLDFLVYIENQKNKGERSSHCQQPENFSEPLNFLPLGCFSDGVQKQRSKSLLSLKKPTALFQNTKTCNNKQINKQAHTLMVWDQLLKTHMLALLAEQIFKVKKSSPPFLIPGHLKANSPWQFNQLYGALVKNEEKLFFYIGHAEIKQTLLLQQHLKKNLSAKSLLLPETLMTQSFRKAFSNLEYLLLTHSQSYTCLLKNLTFFLIYLKLNLLSLTFVLKFKEKV